MDDEGFVTIEKKHKKEKNVNKQEQIYDIKPTESHSVIKNNIPNFKKILCKSLLYNKKCMYGQKCLYAHNLTEQHVSTNRYNAYKIIENCMNNETYKGVMTRELYETLFDMTKVCYKCDTNKCCGGYNCVNGVMSIKYIVCYDDLMFGICSKMECTKNHLTKIGIEPYIRKTEHIENVQQKNMEVTSVNTIVLSFEDNEELDNLDEMEGLLTEDKEYDNTEYVIILEP